MYIYLYRSFKSDSSDIKYITTAKLQCQIFVAEVSYCDFMVWTTVDKVVVRICSDQAFWNMCVGKAVKVFRLAILPELVGSWIDRPAQPLGQAQVHVNKQPQEPSVK